MKYTSIQLLHMEDIENCIFCRIVRREIDSKVLLHDDHITAFDDINPVAPIHVLIVPNRHFGSLGDLQKGEESLLGMMVQTGYRLAKQLGVEKSGFRLVINNGPEAGQSVDHLHFHLIGGRRLGWPPG